MPTFSPEIESFVTEYGARADEWFRIRFVDQDKFEERLRVGLEFGRGPDPNKENKLELTRSSLGMFSFELFRAMICGGESFKPMIVSILWDRLVDAGIMMKVGLNFVGGTPFADHQIDQRRLAEHLNDDTFTNLFVSPSRLPEIYSGAVAAIDVFKNGDPHRGTGFVVSEGDRQFLVTCKHNVDPADGVTATKITAETGEGLCISEFVLSEQFDIAVAPLRRQITSRCFALSDKADVFDEVFTLGYPLVPRAEPILLGHRGEVNGHANLYVEQCSALIISNLVSPGSSGGPVLTRDGRCVGMTINWLEGKKQDKRQGEEKLELMRFSAALPARLLRDSIRTMIEAEERRGRCTEGPGAIEKPIPTVMG